MSSLNSLTAVCFCLLLSHAVSQAQSPIPTDTFVVQCIDQETELGIPLVELETVAHNRYVSDSAGRVAVRDADLLGRKVFFHVRSHGYEFPKDGFGFAGKAIEVVGGQQATLKLKRINLAERLYRATGSGIYVDSVTAGLMPAEIESGHPFVSGDVVGCDSVMTAEYRDKLYWFWGDTNRPHYPIGGNFHITGATTPLPSGDQFTKQPPQFDYFLGADRAIRSVAKLDGDGPTWISAITVMPGSKPQMLANFVKIRNQLDAYRWGFVQWNDAENRFDQVASFDSQPRMFPQSQTHTFLHVDEGQQYVYFCNPLPLIRVRASAAAFIDPDQYEGYTCLRAGTDIKNEELDRDSVGQLVYAWKKNTSPVTQRAQQQMIAAGKMKQNEALIQLREVGSKREVMAHSGTVTWNKYRQRWLMIAVEIGGTKSHLGEVWYAEAPEPIGPWRDARKIVTHEKYSFYNPKHHAFMDSPDGRTIYFEGTYTMTFSGNNFPTPRYEYNQVMYRLDLDRVKAP